MIRAGCTTVLYHLGHSHTTPLIILIWEPLGQLLVRGRQSRLSSELQKLQAVLWVAWSWLEDNIWWNVVCGNQQLLLLGRSPEDRSHALPDPQPAASCTAPCITNRSPVFRYRDFPLTPQPAPCSMYHGPITRDGLVSIQSHRPTW